MAYDGVCGAFLLLEDIVWLLLSIACFVSVYLNHQYSKLERQQSVRKELRASDSASSMTMHSRFVRKCATGRERERDREII